MLFLQKKKKKNGERTNRMISKSCSQIQSVQLDLLS